MKFYKITNKYELCVRSRNEMPYYNYWFRKSKVVNINSKPLGYSVGIHLYWWHISMDVNLFP